MTVKDQPTSDRTAELERELTEKTSLLEKKGRELQIESSLEKVREIALSMKQPADMLEICKTISAQLESLGVKEIRNVQTAIFHPAKGFYFNYEYYTKHDKTVFTETEYRNNQLHNEFAESMLKGAGEIFIRTIKKKELPDWIKYQKTTNVFIDSFLESASSLTYYWYSLGPVALGMSTYVPLNENEIELFKRFKNVFELSYRRYLDIEKAESQAREAQIETSLERVRAVALGMRKADDLLNICETLFHELLSLGFGEMRNAMINIHDDEKKSFINYDFSDEIGRSTNHLTYTIHPLVEKQIRKIRSANDAFSETYFTGKDLEEWKKFRKLIGEKDDPRLNQNSGLYYYFYSIGIGSIGISTFGAISEEKIALLKRFRNVFNLSYQRYSDIAKAEAQAKEAKLEASLEKVRAQAMAMHTTDELKSVGETIYHELKSLGFADIRNTEIIINKDEKESILSYYCDYGVCGTMEVGYKTNPILHQWANDLKKGSDAFVPVVISEKEMPEWRKFREEIGYSPDEKLNAVSSVYYYSYSTGLGALSVSSFVPISDEQLKMLERFRNVFALAYRRYVDVALAEAQAREAQIELALERVRARTMAMQKSDELQDASFVLFQQFKELGTTAIQFSIGIMNEEKEAVELSATVLGSQMPRMYEVPFTDKYVMSKLYRAWKANEKSCIVDIKGKDLNDYNAWRNSFLDKPVYPENNSEKDHWYAQGVFFSKGMMAISSSEKASEQTLQILARFAKVFDLTYTRFLDLKKAEAQARESQIEAALERVRAVAMSMMKSDELLKVCESVFTQLKYLGVADLRSAQIYIRYDDKQKFMNYNYSDYSGTEIVEVLYDSHRNVRGFYDTIAKANDGFAEYEISGTELDDWKSYLYKTLGQKPDAKLETARELHYYFYSIGSGALGICTFKPIGEEELKILKRFRNVFNLSYQRYTDIALAEAQAREAKIELALERVRARTMAMQKSEELSETAQVLFNQFNDLGAAPIQITIGIFNEEEGTIEFHSTDPLGTGSRVDYAVKGSLEEPMLLKKIYADWKEGKKSTVLALSGKELSEWVKYRVSLSGVPDDRDYSHSRRVVYVGFFSKGMLSVSAMDDPPRESVQLLERFAGVFDLTYTRFLDLKQAEAQAREAQIEAALERVRSRTMGMQKSDELKEVIQVVFQQFAHLNINIGHTGFVIDYKARDDYAIWIADPLGVPTQVIVPYFDSVYYNRFNEAKEKGEDFFATNLSFEEKNKFYQKLFEYVPGLPEESKKFYFSCPGLAISTVLLENVCLYIENFEGIPYSDEENATLMRFGKVFQQTYTRFLDLQKAEAQARESQIEASLERVRSRAMAMHESSHLTEAASALFTELNKLGISPIRTGFVLLTKESRKAKLYPATSLDKENTVSYTGEYEFIGHPIFEKQYESWETKENYFPVLEGETLISYYKILSEALSVSFDQFKITDKQYGCFLPFSEGFLFTWSAEPYSSEEIKILERFKNILDLTIRRYLDLQKAEAQAREAQIEAGLERVRSRTLAMHSSDELAETAAVLFKQLILLGIEPNRLYIAIIKNENGDTEFWITDEDGSKVASGFSANMRDNPTFRKMFVGWKEQKKSITIDMQGEELQEYFHHLSSLHVPFKGGLSQTRRVQNIAYFSQGFIGIASPDSQPKETDRLLERFASVFNLTYTRFSDLQLAEAQAKKAQMEAAMERVRSRALAMQQPEELMEVAETLRREMGMLGIEEIETGTIFIFDEANETAQFGFTARDFSAPEKPTVTDTITIDLNETWAGREFLKFFRLKEDRSSVRMEGAQRREWMQYIYSQSPKANNYFGENIRDRTYHLLKFSNGAVAAVTDGLTLSDESWELLQRASSVFTLAYSRFKDLTKAREDLINLKEEKKRSDSLLLNILPEEIAAELKQFGKSYARKHDEVTILFADIKGFSTIAENLSASELVNQLDECFRAFDHIVDKHGLEKIKTVGDAYVCACGLPRPVADHATKTVRAAIDMMNFIKGFAITKTIQDLPAFEFRIGIHTGPVITGVVGLKKFTYDIWGDAVNMAARMEQHGEAGKINISESTYDLIKDKFKCTSRGKIPAKNKGEVEMYFVE